jgi:hypothetical protein
VVRWLGRHSQRPGIPTNLLCLTSYRFLAPLFSPDQIENETPVRDFRRWQKVHLVLLVALSFSACGGCCCARSTPPLRLSAGANETPRRIQSLRFDSTRGCAEELWRGGERASATRPALRKRETSVPAVTRERTQARSTRQHAGPCSVQRGQQR